MQDQPNGQPPLRLPDPDGPEYAAQKVVLLELVVAPPAGGDSIEYLSRVLSLGSTELDAALVALEDVGLAERRNDAVFGSAAALYFEHLWPVRP